MERKLLSIDEVCEYLGIGQTKVREIMRNKNCSFSLKIGRRWYAKKDLLDKWLDEQTKKRHDKAIVK